MTQSGHPYEALTPDAVLDAVESCGYRCDGRQYALNSYENRVYQVWLEDGEILIAKFYRPERWSDAAILEEHAYSIDLASREIPVVAPLVDANKVTLHQHGGFRFALFPRRPGRAPELDRKDNLRWIGRFMARIHAVGAVKKFQHRTTLSVVGMCEEPARYVIDRGFVPPDLHAAYSAIVKESLSRINDCYQRAGKISNIRLHGDCHAGNILWTEQGPHFVDFDDSCSGPAIQDLWMLLSGDREAMTAQIGDIVAGYREFYDFHPAQLGLIEALRTMRVVHYSGWLARRWDDPAFPVSFPWFNTTRYWQEQILALREQCAAMDEAPLQLPDQYR